MLSFVSFLRLLAWEFPELTGPEESQDAVQEWHVLGASSPGGVTPEDARLALGWLAYNLGLRTEKPRRSRPRPGSRKGLERGTFLRDLAREVEAARVLGTDAA
jgi:hypothetical protein